GKLEGETPIIYDFHGFPEELYRQEYHSKGSPKLADRIVDLLTKAKFKATVDTTRGLDHGVWVPFKVAIPEPKDLHKQAHPTDDHLVPIHVAAGAAGQ
ncbi:9982_t:CDS:2, partial [Dentiscutata heterogama]